MSQITNHFSSEELACRCGCGQNILVIRQIAGLEFMRARIMRALRVTSGNRCKAYNAVCGGVENSYHMQGIATDVYADGIDLDTLARAARQYGFTGIGIYRSQGFVHVDTRPGDPDNPITWEE